MTVQDRTLSGYDATAVLSGHTSDASLVIPKGQLRRHLPDFIQSRRTQTKISRTPITFYFAEAEHEQAMIVGCSGFKHDEILNFDQIKRLNQQGVSVMWIALPNPGRNNEFMEHYIHAATDLLLDPQHEEMIKWMARDVPKIYHGHSTGAQMLFHLMRNPETFEKLTTEFSGAALSSTALEYPYKILHSLFRWEANRHPNELPEETTLGRIYLRLSKVGVLETSTEAERQEYLTKQSYIRPTYDQMQELQRYGALALKDIYNPASNINNRGDFPIMMMSGKNDWFASAKPQKSAANAINALHRLSPIADHAPLTQDPQSFDEYQAGITAMANGTFNDFAEQFRPPPRFSYFRKTLPQAATDASPSNAPHAF